MFESILIANRGEIACRIARTCRRLGIRTIAVYSDADSNSRHVREADSAIRIGPPDAASSYLNADAIIEAACAAGASAIHPGYGFLSESLQLVERCATQSITWIGPRAEVIGRMGSKIESKRIAAAAGVLCVPGYHHDEQDPATLLEHAREIGVPLLIKASAGGGGKGMRRVDSIDDFLPQLNLARREAMRAFGDDRVLIEKLIERPRHPYTRALVSAIPTPDPDVERTRQRIVLPGDPPSPINPPSGCAFHPRCPMAVDRCRAEMPPLRPFGDGHEARCWRAEDNLLPVRP